MAGGPDRGRSGRWTGLAIEVYPPLLLTAAWSAVFLKRTEFTVGGKRYFSLFDDAMISMRYAQNLANGHGLRWNPTGAPVEGFTNLLWTLWMSLLHLLPGSDSIRSLYVSATGVLILLGNILVARAIARRLAPGSRRVPILACWFVALYYPIVYWTLRGMEVGALALATAGGVLLALRVVDRGGLRDQVLLAGLLLCAILIRTDAIIPAVVIIVWTVWRLPADRRRAAGLLLGGSGLAGLVIQLALSRAYYGDWLPNTYYLKVSGIPIGTKLHRGIADLISIGILELYLPVILVALYFLYKRKAVDPVVLLLAALFAGQCAYSVVVGGDAWESNQLANRYIATEAIPLLIAAAVAIDTLIRYPSSARWRLLAVGCLPVAFVTAVRIPDWLPGSKLQLGRLPTEWIATRVGVPLLVLVVMALLAIASWKWRSVRSRNSVMFATLGVLLVIATSGREITYWANHNAFLQQDTDSARLGLAVKDATLPGARVAFAAAGASAYFAQRTAIDLGGLSDRTIAHEQPRTTVFIPGHDRYDYQWSVGVLRPDLVIAVGSTSSSDRAHLQSWGYQEVSPFVFVKRGSPYVDLGRLDPVSKYSDG